MQSLKSKSFNDAHPKWVRIALKEIGVHEISGRKHNKRILEYHKQTTLGAVSDEIPWCASFVNWCLFKAGIVGTKKANARSFGSWGFGIARMKPDIGSIVVLWRGDPLGWKGHVGFFMGFNKQGDVMVLGGNQNDSVSIKPYKKEKVLCYKWPSVS